MVGRALDAECRTRPRHGLPEREDLMTLPQLSLLARRIGGDRVAALTHVVHSSSVPQSAPFPRYRTGVVAAS